MKRCLRWSWLLWLNLWWYHRLAHTGPYTDHITIAIITYATTAATTAASNSTVNYKCKRVEEKNIQISNAWIIDKGASNEQFDEINKTKTNQLKSTKLNTQKLMCAETDRVDNSQLDFSLRFWLKISFKLIQIACRFFVQALTFCFINNATEMESYSKKRHAKKSSKLVNIHYNISFYLFSSFFFFRWRIIINWILKLIIILVLLSIKHHRYTPHAHTHFCVEERFYSILPSSYHHQTFNTFEKFIIRKSECMWKCATEKHRKQIDIPKWNILLLIIIIKRYFLCAISQKSDCPVFTVISTARWQFVSSSSSFFSIIVNSYLKAL